jgi:hypothetical protein
MTEEWWVEKIRFCVKEFQVGNADLLLIEFVSGSFQSVRVTTKRSKTQAEI